jgi:hypothetical protein
MTSVNDPKDANFEIKVDGIVRTHRGEREHAIEAAQDYRSRANAGGPSDPPQGWPIEIEFPE